MHTKYNRLWTQEEIALIFKNQGCKLLSKYDTMMKDVSYKCCCGNISKITPQRFIIGQRCKACGLSKRKNYGKKLSYKYIKNYFKKHKCLLLSKKYFIVILT